MAKKKPDLDALGQQFREAQAAVPVHLRKQAVVELERSTWLKQHRHVPSERLYDRKTGAPSDPELADVEARVAQAEADVAWCQAVVLAAGEAFKGEPLAKILARNEEHRHRLGQTVAKGMAALEAGEG